AGLRGSRRAHGRLASQGARSGGAPLRLRPHLRTDRSCARLEPGRGAAGRVDRGPPAAKGEERMRIPTDLDRRFRDAAARSGMRDAGYALVQPPLGGLLVAATDRGLLRISFDPDPDAELERIDRLAGRRVLRS